MARQRVDSDGNSLARNVNRASPAADAANGDDYVQHDAARTLAPHEQTLSDMMTFYADHDTGYLKMRRAAGSPDLHLTWTWSLTPAAGSYVYVRVESWRLLFGLQVLEQKIRDVEAHRMRPTPDRRGGGRPQ